MNPLRPLFLGASLCTVLTLLVSPVQGQDQITVDSDGVMRWGDGGEEVALFGVNYGVPFAHGYRALGYLGVNRKQAIDVDVAHFARLRLDAFRVHVWDREITDRHGNLIINDHLDLLDYLVAKLSDRGIRTILTPIAWWGAGYPEPDPNTTGISDYYSKGEMTTDLEARRAQVNYLQQFISHVNPYTGLSYADDPDIVAVELFNEPSHPGGAEETTRFINVLAQAIRGSGFRKPVFYNISQGYWDEHGLAVCAADIDGVSVQWYPTGLVRNSAVQGNMLPNVDSYPLPFAEFTDCRDKARIVYEFDAADVDGSYMYPAMARSFRGAGFQWATQFAYDPLAFAFANTDYQTHFLNLVYTPAKAISFMIAAEVFRRVPRGASFGTYPATTSFGDFRVSYEDDLSELVADTVFYYSNDTHTRAPSPGSLRRVAGVGSSEVVRYGGTGAYFLDRLDAGVWRLELYPDVAAVEDPYTRGSLKREVVKVLWRERRMRITLSDLGSDFSIAPVPASSTARRVAEDGWFPVMPGVHVLTRHGVTASTVDAEFVAPEASTVDAVVRHFSPEVLTAGQEATLRFEVVTETEADSVLLLWNRAGGGFSGYRPTRLAPVSGYDYAVAVPPDRLEPGLISYRVVVYSKGKARTFPGGDEGHPREWDFTGRQTWRVPVVPDDAPIVVFDAIRDMDQMLLPSFWNYVRYRVDYVNGTRPGKLALRAVVESLDPRPHHLAIRSFLTASQRYRLDRWGGGGVLRIRARAAGNTGDTMNVALTEKNGSAWGVSISLTADWQDHVVPLDSLRRVELALLPRSYPQFLPDVLSVVGSADRPVPGAVEGVQFFVGADLFAGDGRDGAHGYEIEGVTLERR